MDFEEQVCSLSANEMMFYSVQTNSFYKYASTT